MLAPSHLRLLSNGPRTHLASLVLRHLVLRVLPAILPLAEGLPRLRNVHLRTPCQHRPPR